MEHGQQVRVKAPVENSAGVDWSHIQLQTANHCPVCSAPCVSKQLAGLGQYNAESYLYELFGLLSTLFVNFLSSFLILYESASIISLLKIS